MKGKTGQLLIVCAISLTLWLSVPLRAQVAGPS